MTTSSYLLQYKEQLKNALIEDLEATIQKLKSIIHLHSSHRNTLLQVEGDYNRFKKKKDRGLLSFEAQGLEERRINSALMDLIDQLVYADINDPEDEKLREEAKTNTAPTKEATSMATDEAIKISYQDLELFRIKHRTALSFFPQIYRRLGELIVRKENSASIAKQLAPLQAQLPQLARFQHLLAPIIQNRLGIATHTDGAVWMHQLRKFQQLKSDITLSNLQQVAQALPELEQFHQTLKEKELVN